MRKHRPYREASCQQLQGRAQPQPASIPYPGEKKPSDDACPPPPSCPCFTPSGSGRELPMKVLPKLQIWEQSEFAVRATDLGTVCYTAVKNRKRPLGGKTHLLFPMRCRSSCSRPREYREKTLSRGDTGKILATALLLKCLPSGTSVTRALILTVF